MTQGYTGFEAEWHDLFWAAEDAPDEGALVADFLTAVPGPSLYLGSGSGRLLGPLVRAGHEVTGLEVSSEMAKLSRDRFPEARVIEEAWQDHERKGGYESIVIPAFTFQLFPDPRRQLGRLREQSGRLYLTLFFPWAELVGDLPENRWYLDREIDLPGRAKGVLETRHRLREASGSLIRRHRYTLKDAESKVVRREETEQRLRFFTDLSLRKMLAETGWRIEREIRNLGEEGDEEDPVSVATFWLTGAG